MSITLNLPADLEQRLRREAERRGVELEPFAMSLIEKQLADQTVSPSNSLARLFAQWDAEDETSDPQEIARRQQDWEELKAALNANHGSFREPIR